MKFAPVNVFSVYCLYSLVTTQRRQKRNAYIVEALDVIIKESWEEYIGAAGVVGCLLRIWKNNNFLFA